MPGRLGKMFDRLRGKRAALITYATAFYPDRKACMDVIRTMLERGADAVEIGIPFSDPVLDGPVIQESSASALAAGATPAGILVMVSELRRETEKPLLLMSYYNPVLRYGLDGFARDAFEAGADAVVIPDLPIEEMSPWKAAGDRAGLDMVAFCSLTTSGERIQAAADMSSGFLYCVSLLGTTGIREEISDGLPSFLARVRKNASCPIAVGLGISTPEQCARVGKLSDGVIVGSALVKEVMRDGGNRESLGRAVGKLAEALKTRE